MTGRLPLGTVLIANVPLLFVSLGIWGAVMGVIDRPNRRRWWTAFGGVVVVMLVVGAVIVVGLQGLAA